MECRIFEYRIISTLRKLKDDLDHQLTNLKSDYKEMVIQEIEYKADQNLANFWKMNENYKRVSIFSQTDERNYWKKYIDKDFLSLAGANQIR